MLSGHLFGPGGNTTLEYWIDGRRIRASAVLLYRSKFLDCLRGAVANSYPNVDLLWDNVIAGPWGWPRSTVLAKSRPVTNPRRVGTLTICRPGEFSIEKCNPPLVS